MALWSQQWKYRRYTHDIREKTITARVCERSLLNPIFALGSYSTGILARDIGFTRVESHRLRVRCKTRASLFLDGRHVKFTLNPCARTGCRMRRPNASSTETVYIPFLCVKLTINTTPESAPQSSVCIKRTPSTRNQSWRHDIIRAAIAVRTGNYKRTKRNVDAHHAVRGAVEIVFFADNGRSLMIMQIYAYTGRLNGDACLRCGRTTKTIVVLYNND